MISIETDRIQYAYGRQTVLDGVSFTVRQGEFFIIIGPNGSGKTTLMKLLAGIETPQSGRIALMNRPLSQYHRRNLARTIAFVPQTISGDFPFTVREVVLLGRSPHQGLLGMVSRRDADMARQALAFTGVDHLADRKMHQLSGGERQRVFIARAICQEPAVLFLDEPTASLDIAHQGRVMDLMEQLKYEKGTTIVMVSHDVNLAAMYGDSLLLLKNGKVVSMGNPGDVLTYRTLENAYGCPLLVDESPLGGGPRVTLVPKRYAGGDTHGAGRET